MKRPPRSPAQPSRIDGSIFGVGVTLDADDPEILGLMADWLPPAWAPDTPGTEHVGFSIRTHSDGRHQLLRNGYAEEIGSLDNVIGNFELLLRNHVAGVAPDHVFVHAGTASVNGRAIIVPGASFSGKTTMVHALVEAGATYYSDEYAVFDREGWVHPYPKPLAIRDGGDGYRGKSYHEPARIGASIGDEPARLALVVSTQYRPGTVWAPQRLTAAEALIELIPHTYRSDTRAVDTMATLALAVDTSIGLRGDRGDAAELAPLLLAELRS